MALEHFSRGYPRIGQWVLIDGSVLGIFSGPLPAAATKKNGVVEATSKLKVFKTLPTGKTKDWVDLVGEEGEYTGHMLVALDRLTPLLDRNKIPAKRLAKMDPKWQPSP